MRRLLRISSVILVGVAGCVLYGAEEDDVDLPGRTDDAGADASASDAPSNDATSDGNVQPDVVADTGPRLKQIDFEKGKLIDPPLGLDEVLGGPTLVGGSVLQGIYAMNTQASFGTALLPPSDELYVTWRMRVDPSSTNGSVSFMRFATKAMAIFELVIEGGAARYFGAASPSWTLSTSVSIPRDNSKLYFGLHVKRGVGNNNGVVELYALADAGGLVVVASRKDLDIEPIERIHIGSLGGASFRADFDDIFIDRSALP